MLHISNEELLVDLLDPVADRPRLGPRFCWGGYIWQVSAADGQPLLTGPEWPKVDPSPYNGQGLPESFRHRTRDGRPLTWWGNQGIGLGIGELGLNAKGEVEITKPCPWTILTSPGKIQFNTHQSAGDYRYELERTVHLDGRVLISSSQLTNRATEPLALQWFAHPFFALTNRLIDVELPEGTMLVDNPGFTLSGQALRMKRRFENEKDGHMDFIHLPEASVVTATVSHPLLTKIDFSTDFSPDECPIWANSNTFSIEPYCTLRLAPGETKAWTLRYEFGASRK